jgi:hypothetical protein
MTTAAVTTEMKTRAHKIAYDTSQAIYNKACRVYALLPNAASEVVVLSAMRAVRATCELEDDLFGTNDSDVLAKFSAMVVRCDTYVVAAARALENLKRRLDDVAKAMSDAGLS